MENSKKKNELGSLTRAGLIVNIVFCILGIISYLVGVIFVTIGIIFAGKVANGNEVLQDVTAEQAKMILAGLVFILLIFLLLWVLAIFSLIVSACVLKGKSKKLVLAGVLAIFSGGIVAGLLILIGNNNDKQNKLVND